MSARSFSGIAVISLLLSACAGAGRDGGAYPSLAKRGIESGERGETPPLDTAADASAPADPALADQIATLLRQAERGRIAFDTLHDKVAGHVRVATSAPVSSENWVAAHVDLGVLEQVRYDSVIALAGLDALYAERMKAVAEGKARGGISEIQTARTQVLAMVDAQNDRVDALKAVLQEP